MERKRDLSWLKNWRVLTLSGICLFAGFLVGMLIFGSPWHLPPAWGDIPTWISAIATIGLLTGAIITARYAILAFREQSREVAILGEQNDRDIAERRRAQASRVYTGVRDLRPQVSHAYAKNGSDFPVYDAQFWRSDLGGPSGPEDVGMIPPGTTVQSRPLSYQDALATNVLAFRDAAGVRWIRMPDGILKEQTRDTARESVLVALGVPMPPPPGRS